MHADGLWACGNGHHLPCHSTPQAQLFFATLDCLCFVHAYSQVLETWTLYEHSTYHQMASLGICLGELMFLLEAANGSIRVVLGP